MKTPDKETPSEIAELTSLKEARKRLGKTQAQIAIELFANAYKVSAEQLKKLAEKSPQRQMLNMNGDTNVLHIIKAVATCDIPQLTLSEFSRLLDYTSPLQDCTPELIKAILACRFK